MLSTSRRFVSLLFGVLLTASLGAALTPALHTYSRDRVFRGGERFQVTNTKLPEGLSDLGFSLTAGELVVQPRARNAIQVVLAWTASTRPLVEWCREKCSDPITFCFHSSQSASTTTNSECAPQSAALVITPSASAVNVNGKSFSVGAGACLRIEFGGSAVVRAVVSDNPGAVVPLSTVPSAEAVPLPAHPGVTQIPVRLVGTSCGAKLKFPAAMVVYTPLTLPPPEQPSVTEEPEPVAVTDWSTTTTPAPNTTNSTIIADAGPSAGVIGFIVGLVFTFLVAVAAVGVGVFCWLRRKKKRKNASRPTPSVSLTLSIANEAGADAGPEAPPPAPPPPAPPPKRDAPPPAPTTAETSAAVQETQGESLVTPLTAPTQIETKSTRSSRRKKVPEAFFEHPPPPHVLFADATSPPEPESEPHELEVDTSKRFHGVEKWDIDRGDDDRDPHEGENPELRVERLRKSQWHMAPLCVFSGKVEEEERSGVPPDVLEGKAWRAATHQDRTAMHNKAINVGNNLLLKKGFRLRGGRLEAPLRGWRWLKRKQHAPFLNFLVEFAREPDEGKAGQEWDTHYTWRQYARRADLFACYKESCRFQQPPARRDFFMRATYYHMALLLQTPNMNDMDSMPWPVPMLLGIFRQSPKYFQIDEDARPYDITIKDEPMLD